jgi:N-acetylglucosamine-6-sulfatase
LLAAGTIDATLGARHNGTLGHARLGNPKEVDCVQVPVALFCLVGLLLADVVVRLGPLPNRPVGPTAPVHAVQDPRPNIVFITTDDQDLDLLEHMPRVQSLLVERGVRFTNAFVTLPLCSPSHVSMMTGQYPHNYGVMINPSPLGGFVRFQELNGDASTIGTWLTEANYRTGRIGKYLVGYGIGQEYVAPNWDDWRTFYDGYTPFTQYAMNENGAVVHYGTAPANYIVDVLADRAVAFVANPDPRPFFLFFAPPAPHADARPDGPTTPAVRHRGRYTSLTAPRPPSFNEDDVSDKPPDIASRPAFTEEQIADLDYEYRSRAESLLAVDEAVERLMETLQATGKLENTYVVFTSDNGYHLGHHRLPGGKGTFFEEDIRVPLVVRGPGIAPGTRRDEFVLNLDFVPTWVELAGARPGREMDGRSLVPLLRGGARTEPWREDFVVEIYQGTEEVRALRTARWVYAEYAASGARQLYDLQTDPYQLDGVPDMAPPELVAQLAARLHTVAGCAGESCRR